MNDNFFGIIPCDHKPDEIVSAPYIVDPLTINRKPNCEKVGACKINKENNFSDWYSTYFDSYWDFSPCTICINYEPLKSDG